jgi:N-acetyl-anhydromuramyl-L-alanine amidase AmpD
VYWTQPLEAAVAQTGIQQVNEEAVGVGLVGNFTLVAPGPGQIAAAAALIAWLLSRFDLPSDAVVGRRELERVGSPGAQWDSRERYRDGLLARVRAILWSSRGPESIISELRQEVRDLRARVVSGDHLAEQVAGLQAQVERLATGQDPKRPPLNEPSPDDERRSTAVVDPPKWQDVVKTLPRHPSLDPYPRRAKPPTMVVIHHTDTPKNFTVEQIARYHVFGERKDTDGSLIKGPWPGIGYHFVITADGTIYRCQNEMTRSYHVGGTANETSIGVSLIGRFMQRGYDGKVQKTVDQVPTSPQLISAGRLTAWLMQEYGIPEDRVLGHRDVWPRSTACPGEYWRAGPTWRNLLIKEIQIAQDPHSTRQIAHYLLFWDHGVQWAQADWKNAQGYIARFRPTCGFSVDDALLARRVTIVGSTAGVSGAVEAKLKAAGIAVHRLAGSNEAETKALIDALVTKGTPWPGAKARTPSALESAVAERDLEELDLYPIPDEWTIPDDWMPQ